MKTLLKATIFCLLSCSVFSTAMAQESLRDKYFAIMGYFYDPDDLRGTDREGGGADIAFGMQLVGPLYAEARVFGAIFENGIGGGADAYNGGLGFDLQYLIGKRGDFSAFVLGGVAFAYNDAKGTSPDEGVFQGNAGIGLLSRALTSADIRIRIEGRGIYEDYLGGVNDFRVGLGLEIPVDAAEIVVREIVVAGPAEAAAPRQGGYPPRPVDTDNDNVLDNFDVCPGTLPRTKVDRSGCALAAQSVALRGVQFELDSDRLTQDSLSILDQAVRALKGQPPMKVRIAGHTDSIGNASYNEELSMRRARSVRQYLLSQRVNPSRLSVIGYGESQPIASNESEAGRAKNRRVEFEIQLSDPK
ncbi:MAG: OmpA family protein [Oceanococcus sp.]